MKLRVILTGLILVGLLSAFTAVTNQQTMSGTVRMSKLLMKEKVPFEPTILFASAGNQTDDDWQYVGTSKEDIKLYYSPDRIVEHRSVVQAWFKGVYPDSDKKTSYTISLHEFDCRKSTYRLLQGTRYFRDGSARSSNQRSAWERPLPNSLAEMEFRHICRPKLPRRKNVK